MSRGHFVPIGCLTVLGRLARHTPGTGVSTFCWYLPGASAPEGREKVAHGASHGNKRVWQGAPEGRKKPFTGIHPSPGTKSLLTPLRGWRVSGPVPQGLRPGLFSSAPNGGFEPRTHKTGPTRRTRHQGADAG